MKLTRTDLADFRDDVEPTSTETWSEVDCGVSVRQDLPAVGLVVLFLIDGEVSTCEWSAQELGAHFESYLFDDSMADTTDRQYPAMILVRSERDLVVAERKHVGLDDGRSEVRIVVDGETVAAARY